MRPDDDVKERMWSALLKAAKRHHQHDADRGMVTLIARDAGVSRASVSEWKNKRNYPADESLRRLADLYGVSAEALSGYTPGMDVFGTHYGPPDELLRTATDITEQVIKTLMPDASLDQFISVARRANELMVQGISNNEVRGILFDEVIEEMSRQGHQ